MKNHDNRSSNIEDKLHEVISSLYTVLNYIGLILFKEDYIWELYNEID